MAKKLLKRTTTTEEFEVDPEDLESDPERDDSEDEEDSDEDEDSDKPAAQRRKR